MVRDKTDNKIKLNRKAGTFIICFVISSILWLFSALSKDYAIPLTLPVKFINLPKDKTVSNRLPETLDLEIKTNGFGALAFQLGKKADTLRINSLTMKYFKGNDYYVSMNGKLDKMHKSLGKSIRIIKINPDTIYFSFAPKSSRIVPIKANTILTFEKDCQLSGPIKLEPSEIKVSGASTLIEKIKILETQPIKLEEIGKSTTVQTFLKLDNDLKQLDFSTQEISATIPVEKYTEGELEIPVESINIPKRKKVKIFPDKIKVKYQVALSEFEKIQADQFKATVDLSKTGNDKKNKVKIELTQVPKDLKQVKYSPQKAEYILIK